MAEKKGICKNVVNCSLADKEEIQIADDLNFVCSECHNPLEEVSETKKNGGLDPNKKKLIILIAAAVVVIGGGVGAAMGISSSNKKKEAAMLEAQRIQDSIRQVREAEEQRIADSIALVNAANQAAMDEQQRIADSIAQAEEAQRIADSIANAKKKSVKTSTGSASSSTNLGWGSYSGPMQGGNPHGVGGTIRVKSSYSIDLKDGRGSKLDVRSGETIENTKFDNGRLRAGELHRADGTRKWFNC